MSMTSAERIRNRRGSFLAEQTNVMFVLFFLVFFPLLNCSVLGFRTFFLEFAANQSANRAAKAKTFLKPVETSPGVFSLSAYDIGRQSAEEVKGVLPGIDWSKTESNPDVQIVRKPLNPLAEAAQPPKIFSRGQGAPLAGENIPDQSANIYLCRVVIKGRVMPLIALPWCDVPGISCPLEITVSSEALYENISGLVM